jgi:glycosyltransferase involved in cell wall biosynthesis
MKKALKNVLWVTGWYPNRHHSTLGNFIQRHAMAASLYTNITMVAVIASSQQIFRWTITESQNGRLREIILYYPEWMRHFGSRWALRSLLKRMKKDGAAYDVVHGHVLLSSWWMMKAGTGIFTAPTVLTEHWAGFHHHGEQLLPGWKKKGMKSAGLSLSFALPVTKHLGERMKSKGYIKNYTVIGNVVNTKLFVSREKNKNEEFCQFIHVSTLHNEQKNVTGILEVCASLKEINPNFHLEIIGDGDTTPYIDYAKQLGIYPKYVSIKGEQTLHTIAERMRESEALVLFSNYENFPCVIAEAWASGIPVIATNVGGIAEHLNDELGSCIESGDKVNLQNSMLHMIENHYMYDRSTLRAYAEKHFGEEAIGKSFRDIYSAC